MRTDPLLVAVTAALLSTPVLFESLVEGQLPLETAFTRVAVILVLTWVGLAMLGALLRATEDAPQPAAPAPGPREDRATPTLPEDPGSDVR